MSNPCYERLVDIIIGGTGSRYMAESIADSIIEAGWVSPEDHRAALEGEIYCLKDSDGVWWVSTDPDKDVDLSYDATRVRWPAFIGAAWTAPPQ